MENTFIVVVEDRPGVVNRITALCWQRNFRLRSFSLCRTADPHCLQLTLSFGTNSAPTERIKSNLQKLVEVVAVHELNQQSAVLCEMALLKVSFTPARFRQIRKLIGRFHATVADISSSSLTIQIGGTEAEVNSLINELQPHGILEIARTGHVAMLRE